MSGKRYSKPEFEFFDPTGIEHRQVEGYPDGIYERILSKDEATGDYTRLLYFKPGVVTKDVLVHDFWEEVYIVKGGLIDLTRNEVYPEGYYACRPPGMRHGPYSTPLGCITFEVRTRKVKRLATGVLVLPVRNPVVLAKEIGTLQVLTDNRFVLGIGPGWDAKEFEATGSRISERGARTDEMMEALETLLTRDNASYHGRYYSFDDVTIVPRPNRMPEVWVAGGARVPDPTQDENIHDPDYIHPSVVRRIVKYGRWLSRCSGTQEWLKRDWELVKSESRKLGKDPSQLIFGHCNFCYFTPFRNREDAHQVQRKYYERAMGTRRGWDHLQKCYFTGTIGDQIERLEDLVEHGLEYMVFGPLSAELWQLDVIGKDFVPRFF